MVATVAGGNGKRIGRQPRHVWVGNLDDAQRDNDEQINDYLVANWPNRQPSLPSLMKSACIFTNSPDTQRPPHFCYYFICHCRLNHHCFVYFVGPQGNISEV